MVQTSSKPKAEYAIQTVANAMRMLEVFHTESEMGVSDLARRLDLHKNNAFRLLATLELGGYIRQNPETGLYGLGPRCLELGESYSRNHDLVEQARPILEALSATTLETAHLGSLIDLEVIHLDAIQPDQLVLTGSRVGARLPAHCTALGKVMLAGFLADSLSPASSAPLDSLSVSPSDDSHSASRASSPPRPLSPPESGDFGLGVIRDREIVGYTDTTIVDPMKLIDELRNVEMRGYAVDLEEYSPGLCCVAAPIRNAASKVVAAISISGPSFRLSESALHGDAASAVVAAAGQLSQMLGAPA